MTRDKFQTAIRAKVDALLGPIDADEAVIIIVSRKGFHVSRVSTLFPETVDALPAIVRFVT